MYMYVHVYIYTWIYICIIQTPQRVSSVGERRRFTCAIYDEYKMQRRCLVTSHIWMHHFTYVLRESRHTYELEGVRLRRVVCAVFLAFWIITSWRVMHSRVVCVPPVKTCAVCHVSFVRVAWLLGFLSVTWPCDMTASYFFFGGMTLFMCDTNPSHVSRDPPYMSVTWCIRMCDVNKHAPWRVPCHITLMKVHVTSHYWRNKSNIWNIHITH